MKANSRKCAVSRVIVTVTIVLFMGHSVLLGWISRVRLGVLTTLTAITVGCVHLGVRLGTMIVMPDPLQHAVHGVQLMDSMIAITDIILTAWLHGVIVWTVTSGQALPDVGFGVVLV